MTHDNSRAAYEEGRREGFSARELAILDLLAQAREVRGGRYGLYALTDRMIKEGLGLPDMNAVRPRITELIKRGLLVELSNVIDPLTKKRVRVVALRA